MHEPTDLTKPQRQRADALVISARLLGSTPGPFTGGGGLPEDRTTIDLTDLAQFILDGTHPLEPYREASVMPIRFAIQEFTPVDNPGDDDLRVAYEASRDGEAGK